MNLARSAEHGRTTARRSFETISTIAMRTSLITIRMMSDQLAGPSPDSKSHTALMARHARTFYFATRFMPAFRRRPTVSLYAFFRTIDDLIDEQAAELPDDVPLVELEIWRRWFRSGFSTCPSRPEIANPLARTITRYKIPVSYFLDFLDGMQGDLDHKGFNNYKDLEVYCYRVASTVGLTMAHLFSATSDDALQSAYDLGIGMQLTNILRDVGGDLAHGRVYLPTRELDQFNLAVSDLSAIRRGTSVSRSEFDRLMQWQIERADTYYERAIPGINLLPSDCRLPILIAARLYQRILREIEHNGFNTLSKRAHTTTAQKSVAALRAVAGNYFCRSMPMAEQMLPSQHSSFADLVH